MGRLNQQAHLVITLVAAITTGCATIKETRTVKDEVLRITHAPTPTLQPATYEPRVTRNGGELLINVKTFEPCGYASTKLVRREVSIERTMERPSKEAWAPEIFGSIFLLTGAFFLWAMPQDPVTGAALTGVGTALFIPLGVDLFRARDERSVTDEVPVPVAPTFDGRCNEIPFANAEVVLGTADNRKMLPLTTNSEGVIALDSRQLLQSASFKSCGTERYVRCADFVLRVGDSTIDFAPAGEMQMLIAAAIDDAKEMERQRQREEVRRAYEEEQRRKREEAMKSPAAWAEWIEDAVSLFVRSQNDLYSMVGAGYATRACEERWPAVTKLEANVCTLIDQARSNLSESDFKSLPDRFFKSVAYRAGDREAHAATSILKDFMKRPANKCALYPTMKCR